MTRSTENRARVAIVGGGLAGLTAAWRLLRLGMHDLVLLEARERLGGRILDTGANGHTNGDVNGRAPGGFDLGPAWFWPEVQDDLDALVATLGLQRFVQFEDGDMVVERSPQQPPERMRGYRSEPPSMRLAGGMGALVDALSDALFATLPPERIVTGCRVHTLRLADGCVLLHSDGPQGGGMAWRADHVLLALPPRIAVRDLACTPALPPALLRQWQATDTWMAPHAKYLAVYDTPFWRSQGLSGEARSACGPMAEIHDASLPDGHAGLFGFVGVPARVRQGVAEQVLKAHCRAQLGRLFGAAALAPLAEMFKDWAADPFTTTDADLQGSGEHPHPPASAADEGPWRGRLRGIGSEWSARFPGYLAGAVDAARQGVQAWWAQQAPGGPTR